MHHKWAHAKTHAQVEIFPLWAFMLRSPWPISIMAVQNFHKSALGSYALSPCATSAPTPSRWAPICTPADRAMSSCHVRSIQVQLITQSCTHVDFVQVAKHLSLFGQKLDLWCPFEIWSLVPYSDFGNAGNGASIYPKFNIRRHDQSEYLEYAFFWRRLASLFGGAGLVLWSVTTVSLPVSKLSLLNPIPP